MFNVSPLLRGAYRWPANPLVFIDRNSVDASSSTLVLLKLMRLLSFDTDVCDYLNPLSCPWITCIMKGWVICQLVKLVIFYRDDEVHRLDRFIKEGSTVSTIEVVSPSEPTSTECYSDPSA
ncbi:uncharacterized protein [Elaeis guineensis]|uniref:Uncharacterized protein LOC105047230 n=1 Tax=Elaeis guineensis var. tenera TaxID=51953 RepID=A0A6I9RCJ9_ELAGV|nr:uncharacterized protein LOC105047230 [Elaeis guineensis]